MYSSKYNNTFRYLHFKYKDTFLRLQNKIGKGKKNTPFELFLVTDR